MKRALLCSCGILATAIGSSPAFAQDAAAEEVDQNVIIVTANKREQNVQDVPSSVTAVTAETLEARGVSDPSDLIAIVPNLSGGTSRGDTALAIRGVGLTVLGSSPGVAIHVDGVYQPRPQMADIAQVDIGQVEVLRGPQGTLYGRNANGGVINFKTTKPGSEVGGYVRASYATFDEYKIEGGLDLPISDAVRVRFTGKRWERGKGFVKNINPNGSGDVDKGDSLFGRIHLEADLGPDVTASLIGTFARRRGEFIYFTQVGTPLPQAVAQNPILNTATFPTRARQTAQNDPVSQNRRYKGITGILEWNSGDFGIKSITAYQHYKDEFSADFDALDVSQSPRQDQQEAKTFTQELNFTLNTGPLKAVVGGFYMDDEFSNKLDFQFPVGIFQLGSPAGLPPGSTLSFSSDPYKTKSKAVFADFTVDVTDRLLLLGGIRYSEDSQRIREVNGIFVQTPGGPFQIPPTACPNPNNLTGESAVKFSSTTPRVGLQYRASDDSNLYASYSQGFKIGGFNYRGGCGASYGSEKLTAYEIGSKNQFGDLTLNVAGFYYDYKDLQVEQLVGFSFVLNNAPKAKVYGAEVETSYRAGPLTLNANASLMSARYGAGFLNLDLLDAAAGLQNTDGNALSNAPDFSANIGASYETDPVIAGGALTFRADLSYKSRIFFREFGNNADSQPGYALVDASVTWRSEDERFSVRAFGRNLTGKDYFQSLASSSSTGTRFVTWGSPRQVGLELGLNF
ncbi:MAG: TonB-dependent receptor [Parasphingorhabdus sp.]|uniref:TonB-dependent receptor n=1 Tax=Parasphingorhabdus sp. TaxID=2709688 RepID=UPI00326384F2